MSKFLGPLWKKSRALHFSLLGNKKEFSRGKKRITSPGMHGGKRKKRLSPYGLRLQAKQRLMHGFGWRNKQLKNEFIKVKSKAGDAGVNLLINSESRLDNIIFRSGLASTLRCARQWVNHKHFLVDGKTVNIPSFKVEPGQVISLKKEKMVENKLVKNNLEQNIKFPSYLNFDKQKFTINYLRPPQPEELNQEIDTSLVVEWYNRRI
ncbi:MAG: 30S ribosomal protein S4 [Mycoplasmataceae bacterium RV_VA103A]|nr:MAG: 30S ribosomal protein S4 [Mycoplasmataceae bacterium RV_VA103A]